MNIEKMMNALDAHTQKVEDAREREMQAYKADMMAYGQSVAENLAKIREIRPVVMRLFSEGLVPKTSSSYFATYELLTDGIEHRLGFFRGKGGINFGRFGIEGGGYSCDSVCVDIDTGKWSRNCGTYDEGWDEFAPLEQFIENSHRAYRAGYMVDLYNYDNFAVRGKIEAIALGIDGFVQKVESLVARITKTKVA